MVNLVIGQFFAFFRIRLENEDRHNLITTSNRADCSKSFTHSPTDQYFSLLFCLWSLFEFEAFYIKRKMKNIYRRNALSGSAIGDIILLAWEFF